MLTLTLTLTLTAARADQQLAADQTPRAAPSDDGTEGTAVLTKATVTVAEGSFVQLPLRWTGVLQLAQVADYLSGLGLVTLQDLRELLKIPDSDWDGVGDCKQFLEMLIRHGLLPASTSSSKPDGLTPRAMQKLIEMVKTVRGKAQAEARGTIECFFEVAFGMGAKNFEAENDEQVTKMDLLKKHQKQVKVVGLRKIGFTITLDGDIPQDEKEKKELHEHLQEALEMLLPEDAKVRSLKRGCILVTCEWLSGGAWELPLAVRQALSDPTFKLAGFPLLFEDGAPSLKIEYFKVQICASLECLQLLG